jgi:hypothetical protein
MEAKGYVRRDRTLYVHVFAAVFNREELIGRRLRSLAELLCDGSLTPLLTHLARAKDLTDQDRQALRAIFDEVESSVGAIATNHGKQSGAKSAEEPSRTSPPRALGGAPGRAGR